MKFFIVSIFASLLFISCNEKEMLEVDTAIDYFPLEVGRSLFYRLDSTVPAPFGTALVKRYYLAKDSIESKFTDNEGRESYRIYRFLRDTLQTQAWTFNSTFYATIDDGGKTIEYNDNNLRYLKLRGPISEGFSFKGNTQINTAAGGPFYYLDDWDYMYTNVNQPYTVRYGTFDTTVTVQQQDIQDPEIFDPTRYNAKTYAKEVYAKGVGLIYREWLYYIYQTTPPPSYYTDDSYGITLNLIDYR